MRELMYEEWPTMIVRKMCDYATGCSVRHVLEPYTSYRRSISISESRTDSTNGLYYQSTVESLMTVN